MGNMNYPKLRVIFRWAKNSLVHPVKTGNICSFGLKYMDKQKTGSDTSISISVDRYWFYVSVSMRLQMGGRGLASFIYSVCSQLSVKVHYRLWAYGLGWLYGSCFGLITICSEHNPNRHNSVHTLN